MPTLIRIALLTAALAVATLALGWWGVPLAAAVYGAIASRDRALAVITGLSGIFAWGALLLIDASKGPVGSLAATLAGVLNTKPIAVYVLTLAFPGLLAVTAAILGRWLGSLRA